MGRISQKIGKLRAFTESEMPSAMTVKERQQTGRDQYGDPIYSEVTVLASPCRLRSQNGQEQVIAGRLQATSNYTLVYPHDVALKENQTVEVSGETYNVVYVERGTAELRAHGKSLVARA